MLLGTTSLTALNQPKDAFLVIIIASITNILLDIILIPILGITGAAIATLIAMTFNAVGALVILSRVISVKFEYNQIKNILYASGLMGIFLLIIHFLLPITHVITLLTLVVVGAIVYIFVLFKLDRKIHDEIKELSVNLGVPWPGSI
jgi:O-antigen/teichoic acid export membrane protein